MSPIQEDLPSGIECDTGPRYVQSKYSQSSMGSMLRCNVFKTN